MPSQRRGGCRGRSKWRARSYGKNGDVLHSTPVCDTTTKPPRARSGVAEGRSRIGPTVRHDVPGVVAMAGLGRIIVTLSTSRPACVSWRGSG